jgi:hypothetical protein
MKKLAKIEVLPALRRAGRHHQKIVDLRKANKVRVAKPESPEHAIETLLIFDARCLSRQTRQELLRLLPELLEVRRAWRAEYSEYGCLNCPKPSPTVAIAARLRRRGATWAEIYEITAPNATATRAERKRFESRVRWKLEHLDVPERQPTHQYGAGGFCNRCAARIYQRMRNRFRKATQGRNLPAELAAFKDALQLRYNAAQRLFNGDD